MELQLDLDGVPGSSLRARMELALRTAIRERRLLAGTRLPATRALAAQMGVSRGVVVNAYAQLAAEGYVQTRRGGGTVVAAGATTAPARPPALLSRPPTRYDMSPFRPALNGFPRVAWRTAVGRVLAGAPDERLGYPEPAGTAELRAALAGYLGRVRGVQAEPADVLVTAGLRAGLSVVLAALAATGARRVAVEQPGWRGVRETAVAAGLAAVPLGVDGDGALVAQLGEHAADVVVVAPAHQYPTGAVLSPSRRAALLDWARRTGGLIVEDDYDAEYRYDRHPVGALQGLAPEHVVYGGSASKTVAPALRLGWMVLPSRLHGPALARQRAGGWAPSALEQLALADMIERGELDRHLRRQRRRYRRQRAVLLDALTLALPGLAVRGAAAGLFVVLHLPAGADEAATVAAARERGLTLEGLGGRPPGLVIGYANLAEPAIAPAVRALAASIEQAGPRR